MAQQDHKDQQELMDQLVQQALKGNQDQPDLQVDRLVQLDQLLLFRDQPDLKGNQVQQALRVDQLAPVAQQDLQERPV